MDARKCLEIAKGWLEQAAEADDQEDVARYLDMGKRWLTAGQACFELESCMRWREEDERRLASDQEIDGPAEGEDG